jgi:nicotinamide-nucleotide amidase
VAGSSDYFRGGAVVYANDVKTALVGVREETLRAHGAVSRETAIEMAEGARAKFGATWGGAVTGIAGPGGGTPEKPVGTVEIAIAGPGVVEHRHLLWPPFEREQVRLISASALLHLLYKVLTR